MISEKLINLGVVGAGQFWCHIYFVKREIGYRDPGSRTLALYAQALCYCMYGDVITMLLHLPEMPSSFCRSAVVL